MIDNVINIPDQGDFWLANMLKKTIKHEKKVNLDGRYDEAIYKDEALLRSFFDKALGRSEAQLEAVA